MADLSRAVEMSDASPASLHYLAKALKVAACSESSMSLENRCWYVHGVHTPFTAVMTIVGRDNIEGTFHAHMNAPHTTREEPRRAMLR